MAVAADPIPTERARELVRGGFDTHIHVDPDVIARRVDDVTLDRALRRARAWPASC